MRTVKLPSGETVPALGQGTWYMHRLPCKVRASCRKLLLDYVTTSTPTERAVGPQLRCTPRRATTSGHASSQAGGSYGPGR